MQPSNQMPSNGILGDNSGVELPEAPVDDSEKKELTNKVKYSKTKEYKELRAKAQERIDFYKTTLPAGYSEADRTRKAEMWGTANLIIAEFTALFGEIDTAEELLKELYSEQEYER